jgi:hypothetical protein
MTDRKPEPRESTKYLTMGLGVGAIGAVGAIVGAAACPVCIVATPALLGLGLYKRWKEREAAREVAPPPPVRSAVQQEES